MASWEGLRSHIKSNYNVAGDELEFMMLGFQLDSGRTQKIVVRKLTLGRDEWAEISSPVCRVADIDPGEALRRNGQMVFGGLAVADWDNEMVIFRHSLPLKDLDVDEFEVPFHVAVNFADALEQELTGGDQF